MHKVAVLQARLASSRYPKRVLADLSGKPVVAHCVDRLNNCSQIDQVCVAIPAGEHEDELASVVESLDATLVRGNESDVLGRYIQAAYETKADIIVRAWADNPLVSVSNIDRQVEALLGGEEYDFVYTEGLPGGCSAETMSLKTLEKLDYLSRHADMRKQVTLYLYKNSGPFQVCHLLAPDELKRPAYSFSLDSPGNYELLSTIYTALYKEGETICIKDVLSLVDSDAHLKTLAERIVGAAAG